MSPIRAARTARRRLGRPATALLTAVVIAGLAGATNAAGQPAEQPDLAEGVPVADSLPAGTVPTISPVLRTARGPVTVFVELEQTPAIDVYNDERQRGRSADQAADAVNAARDQVGQAVDRVLGTLRTLSSGTRELYRTANAVPGVVVTADAAAVRELADSPDVRAVYKTVPKSQTNASAVQLTETLRVWQQTGRFGDGVRIGIIDDGVDYTHANFGGPGTPEAYDAIDRTAVDPSYFPTDKVVGGHDFAGDDYDASGGSGPENVEPRPDPNPLSCGDHGAHVAGTAAGFGVNADGSTFRGDYRQLDAESLGGMRIGPGTAPNALVYALKVFGCAGSTDLTSQALDWALDPDGDGDYSDRLDVVNLSLGSDYGAPDDPDSLFVRKLAQNGVVPVFSAGNGGDLYDIGGSPGNTPEALTVASGRDSFVLRDGIEVTAPEDVTGIRGGQYSQDYEGYDTLNLTAGVVPMTAEGNRDGCDPYSPEDAAAVAGNHVWLEWDDNDATRRCGSAARADNAEQAGAVGVIITSSLRHFNAAIAGNAGVPMFQLTGPDTDALRPALDAGTLTMRMAGELRTSVPTQDPQITDTPSEFTSRSVRAPSVKPDVTAPGDTITSTLTGSGDGRLVLSGTSMASPHVAGITALVRQAHPDWTVEEVKAAVINTAGADIFAEEGQQGDIHAPNRVGAGRVNARAALDTQVLAMVEDDPGQVSASFGVVEVDRPVALTKTIRVVNKGPDAASFDVSYQPLTTIPGVSYELSTDSVELSPRGVATVDVTLRIDDPGQLRRTSDPTIERSQLGAARQFVADASGRIALDPTSGADVGLRVPVHAAPEPVADITGPDSVRFGPQADQAVLELSGRGVDQGSDAEAYRSLVSAMQLQVSSPRLPECHGVLQADCTPNETARAGDIRYVGAASTAPLAREQGNPESAVLAFGIVSWADWYNVGNNTIPFVDIDTTGDGVPDFETIVTTAPSTDVLLAITVDLNQEGAPTVDLLPVNGQFGNVHTNVFDSNVVVAPVSLSALGIDPSADSAPISYTTGIAGYYTGPGDDDGVIDTTEQVNYDPLRPGLWVQGGGDPALSYVARPATALVVNRDVEAALRQRANRLLLLHHHNAGGDRAQVVRVRGLGAPPVPADGAPPVAGPPEQVPPAQDGLPAPTGG